MYFTADKSESNQQVTSYLLSEAGCFVRPVVNPHRYLKPFKTIAVGIALLGPTSLVHQWKGANMHVLAHLAAVPKAKQLELFADAPVVSLDGLNKDLQGSPKDGLAIQSGVLFNEVQVVDVSLSQADQNPLNNLLHSASGCADARPIPNTVQDSYLVDVKRMSGIPENVTNVKICRHAVTDALESALPSPSCQAGALSDSNRRAPLEFLIGPKGSGLSERVCARLIQAEAHETHTSLRSDYRQAFICVSLASKGNTEPFTVSSYEVHGKHQDLVWPQIVADRKAKLGKEYYDWYDFSDMPRPDVPKFKKPPVYEPQPNERIAALLPSFAAKAANGPPSQRDPSAYYPSEIGKESQSLPGLSYSEAASADARDGSHRDVIPDRALRPTKISGLPIAPEAGEEPHTDPIAPSPALPKIQKKEFSA